MGTSTVSTEDVRGALVWVDDVYMKKFEHTQGENLIVDGSIENSDNADFAAIPSEKCSWYHSWNSSLSNCDILRVTSGANGEASTDTVLRAVDGTPVDHSGTNTYETDAGITHVERRSGNNALVLRLPGFEYEAGCLTYPCSVGPIVSISTNIDFTDLVGCSYYESNGFIDFPCTTCTANTYTDQKYKVKNNITISAGQTLTLEGCTLVMGPDITITVDGTLNIIQSSIANSYLFACSEMWKGIKVTSTGKLYTNGQTTIGNGIGTMLEGAKVAIDVDGGLGEITNTQFDHNLQAIFIKNNPNTGSKIEGCTFKCSNGFIGKSPNAALFPHEHVRLENITNFQFPVGKLSGSINKFYDAFIGIYTYEAKVKIRRNKFYEIYNRNSIYQSTTEGQAIYINNYPGAYTSGLQTTILDNTFENVNIGIKIWNRDPNASIGVSGNSFDNSKYNDVFVGPNFHNTAITIQNGHAININTFYVNDNEVTDFRIGLHALNVSHPRIGFDDAIPPNPFGNTINFKIETGLVLTEIYRGIWLQNCSDALMANNVISNMDEITGTTTDFRGIDVEHSSNCHINCNEILNIPYSIHFLGHCDGTLLRANEMTHYDEGVHLESATIADQIQVNDMSGLDEPTDNIWNDQTTGIGIPTDRVAGTITGGQFNWLYQTLDGKYNPLDAGMTSVIIAVTPETAGSIDCDDETNRQSRQTRFGATVGDSLNFTDLVEENTWMARKYAYECMKLDSAILYQDSISDAVYQAFFWAQDSLNTGKFTTIRLLSADSATFGYAEVLNETLIPDNSLESNLKAANSFYFSKLAEEEGFDESDSAAVLEIANLPYFTGGEGTYLSIGMLGLELTPTIPSLRLQTPSIPVTIPLTVSNTLQLYPNPTTDYLNVSSAHDQINKVEIYDAQVKLLQTYKVKSATIAININYKPGIYGVKVYLENGVTKWFKIVKL